MSAVHPLVTDQQWPPANQASIGIQLAGIEQFQEDKWFECRTRTGQPASCYIKVTFRENFRRSDIQDNDRRLARPIGDPL
ncbi:MAG: hypothetical protein DMG30_18500 [Acidobacteria bacterium]|nr:MAG: hypothetical protein DMG30_18500 [Acidobacteriota bacterium]